VILEPLLLHPSARVQRRALRAVAELGRSDLADVVRSLRSDPRWEVEASLVLARLGRADPCVLDVLERAVRSAATGWSAAALLAALQPEAQRDRVLAWARQGRLRAGTRRSIPARGRGCVSSCAARVPASAARLRRGCSECAQKRPRSRPTRA
jgi:hypothetical protein